jgi:hypothetical protein
MLINIISFFFSTSAAIASKFAHQKVLALITNQENITSDHNHE